MQSIGVYLLTLEHVAAIQRLVTDPTIAPTTRIKSPYAGEDVRRYVEQLIQERTEGSAYGYVITDQRELVGACELYGIGDAQGAALAFWIGRPYRGKGYASFGVNNVLQFAFQNLQLDRVRSTLTGVNVAAERVLIKNKFVKSPADVSSSSVSASERAGQRVVFELTRRRWLDSRNDTALTALHSSLRKILADEIAAGNEIAETGGGWPDPDSVFVRLRHPFRTKPSPIPGDVVYTEPNDPHWWKADYSSRSPRHILAC